jgi:hypothetical protein
MRFSPNQFICHNVSLASFLMAMAACIRQVAWHVGKEVRFVSFWSKLLASCRNRSAMSRRGVMPNESFGDRNWPLFVSIGESFSVPNDSNSHIAEHKWRLQATGYRQLPQRDPRFSFHEQKQSVVWEEIHIDSRK